MENLWAPWRMRYIQDVDIKEGCVFCLAPKDTDDKKNHLIYRGKHNFVIMNIFPYNNGHLMIVPYEHTSSIDSLVDEAALELWHLVRHAKNALLESFNPEGFNIGMNLGRIGGAGIDEHIHMHIVPRWNGDTNFMPVIGQTKVISQSLEDAYDALKPHFDQLKSYTAEP
ncbi:MAG: HIT family protein [Chitinivibrionales bacterium]